MSKYVSGILNFLILFFIMTFVLDARPQSKSIVIGEKIEIFSDVLKENRELQIYLPQDYRQSQDRYPVIYLLDGEWHFFHTAGLVQFLSSPGVEKIPSMIVIAISNTSRGRDFSPSTWPGYKTYTGGADRFVEFLDKELIPYVEKSYRTKPFKILAGHSLAGTFALYAFLTKPENFDAYIPLSPCLFWHDRFMLKKTEDFLDAHKGLDKILFIAHEYAGGLPASTMQEFVDAFNRHAPKDLKWHCLFMDQDDHFSLVHKGFYSGLEFVFSKK